MERRRVELAVILPSHGAGQVDWGGVGTFGDAVLRVLEDRPDVPVLVPDDAGGHGAGRGAGGARDERNAGTGGSSGRPDDAGGASGARISLAVGAGPWHRRMTSFAEQAGQWADRRARRLLACDYWAVPPRLDRRVAVTLVAPLLPTELMAALLTERAGASFGRSHRATTDEAPPSAPWTHRLLPLPPLSPALLPRWLASLVVERRALARADRVLVPNGEMAWMPRARVLPWGSPELGPADDRERARRALGIDPDERVVLSLGRIHPQKGLDCVIDAASRLRREERWTLALVGPVADERHFQRLRTRARRAEHGSLRVLWPGPVEDEGRALWLGASDVYASGAVYEPFGLSVREALAAGVPTVGLAVGGLREVLGPPGAIAVAAGPRTDRPARMAAAIEAITARAPGPAEVRRSLPSRTLRDAAREAIELALEPDGAR